MEFPDGLRRWRFRQLVALFGVSLIYDIAWFFINQNSDEDDDGGLEYNVRRFSRIISYVSFFWRILLSIILEKVSLDFLAIIKGKKHNLKHAESLEYRVQRIVEEHEKHYQRESYEESVQGFNIERAWNRFDIMI